MMIVITTGLASLYMNVLLLATLLLPNAEGDGHKHADWGCGRQFNSAALCIMTIDLALLDSADVSHFPLGDVMTGHAPCQSL